MNQNIPLHATGPLTTLVRSQGISTWQQLLEQVRQIPYGRNARRTDFSLVLTENRGTCSSKHALLKAVADENEWPDVELILGMYRMQAQNTPGIGTALQASKLDYIPEAHCYLRIAGERMDFTNPTASIVRIEDAILLERPIQPEQVGTFKVDFHQDYLKQWISETGLTYTFEQVWQIREQCIQNLSTSTTES